MRDLTSEGDPVADGTFSLIAPRLLCLPTATLTRTSRSGKLATDNHSATHVFVRSRTRGSRPFQHALSSTASECPRAGPGRPYLNHRVIVFPMTHQTKK